ncbi:MAG: hypothetical protein ACKVQQ_23895 [Burkholderiales bacterium]
MSASAATLVGTNTWAAYLGRTSGQTFGIAVRADAPSRIDAPVMYLDGLDYENHVATTYRKQAMLIERLKLKELLKS